MTEYLRRNKAVAKAVGVKSAATTALNRLDRMKSPPRWVVAAFESIASRADGLPTELAKWRDSAPDAPQD